MSSAGHRVLKGFQKEAANAFADFNEKLGEGSGVREAFENSIFERTNQEVQYRYPAWSDRSQRDKIPVVSLAAPTGAGKTTIASCIVADLLASQPETRLLILLAPTTAIIQQTLREYNNSSSMVRKQINKKLPAGRTVKVVDRDQALNLSPSVFKNNLVILVSSVSGLRRDDSEGLLAYRENGSLMNHFDQLTVEQNKIPLFTDAGSSDLKTAAEKKPFVSLMNLIRLHQPVVVADESHNVKSKLSWRMLESFNPSFVLEMTATPRENANILHRVSALDVKEAEMIRLPVEIFNQSSWREAIRNSIQKREELEKIAVNSSALNKKPIVLIQVGASDVEKPGSKKISAFEAKQELMNQGVCEENIAFALGHKNEILDQDINDCANPIEYVITVQAAAEGWDCPRAMILCALAAKNSHIGVGQVFGRILRQYGAKRETEEELNRSYVFTSSNSFAKALVDIQNAMENNGYDVSDIACANNATPAKDTFVTAKLNPRFADYTLPALARWVNGIFHPVQENKSLANLSAKEGLVIDKSAVPVKNKNVAVKKLIDIRADGLITTEEAIGSEESMIQDISDVQRHLSRVPVKDVVQEDIADIVEVTLEKLITEGWTKDEIRQSRQEIEKSLIGEIKQRLAACCKKTAETSRAIRPARKPLAKEVTFKPSVFQSFISDKHFYDQIPEMNQQEFEIAQAISNEDNVKAWFRIPENVKHSYCIPTFEGKHYPDFYVLLKTGEELLIEHKGGHLVGSDDTVKKQWAGGILEKIHGSNRVKYFLVTTSSNNSDDSVISLNDLKAEMRASTLKNSEPAKEECIEYSPIPEDRWYR